MLYMKARQIEYSIGTRQMFDIPELTIYQGDRIGLVGKNGQGKTLLFHYLMGELTGSPHVQCHTEVAWLRQLEEPEDGWRHHSGGEITQKRLQQMWEKKKPLLFLDEPTNNLDWQHIEWLEKKLISHQGAYVVVSHDRTFLNRVCDKIWELQEGKLSVYNGDYSFYGSEKEREHQQRVEKHQKYVEEKKRLENRVRQKQEQSKGMRKPPSRMGNSEWQLYKNKAAGKQKKVERVGKNLLKRLDRLEKVDKPFEWDQVKMFHQGGQELHQRYISQISDVDVTAGGRHLFHAERLSLKGGSKTAIIGKNGCGKTTLVEQMLEKRGDWFVQDITIHYFRQSLSTLPEDATILEFASKDSALPESQIRTILARLRFYEDDINKRIGVLSGGERVKLALAHLLTRKAHLIILDEPTNHLDLDAIKALEMLIEEYNGTVLYVTHDRTFIERTANHLWVIEDKKLINFEGTLEEWKEEKARPKEVSDQVYDEMTLQNELNAIIGKLSMPSPKDDVEALEEEYQQTLALLKKIRQA